MPDRLGTREVRHWMSNRLIRSFDIHTRADIEEANNFAIETAKAKQWRLYIVANGRSSKLILPDGSWHYL